jgi:hypothetical protein
MTETTRCVWCRNSALEGATFLGESHIVPQCVGNKSQILHAGIVCDECNDSFSHEVEHELIHDPIFSNIVACLQIRDPKLSFIYERLPGGGIDRTARFNVEIQPSILTVDIEYEIKGQPSKQKEVRHFRESKTYKYRDFSFLSRAVYKIAFETLCWEVFVRGEHREIDVFSSAYDYVRDWSRNGKPHGYVRPFLRSQSPQQIDHFFSVVLYESGTVVLNLIGDVFVVGLFGSNDKIGDSLKTWVKSRKPQTTFWYVGERMSPIDK